MPCEANTRLPSRNALFGTPKHTVHLALLHASHGTAMQNSWHDLIHPNALFNVFHCTISCLMLYFLIPTFGSLTNLSMTYMCYAVWCAS